MIDKMVHLLKLSNMSLYSQRNLTQKKSCSEDGIKYYSTNIKTKPKTQPSIKLNELLSYHQIKYKQKIRVRGKALDQEE